MAGSDPTGAFVAAEFRANIRGVNYLGMPENEALRPIFLFPRDRTWVDSQADDGGQPLDWSSSPSTDSDVTPGERRVTCGQGADQILPSWEAAGGRGGTQSNETNFGDFDALRMVFYVLDVDYPKIVGFNRVLIAGSTYFYQMEQPTAGLYEVTTHLVTVGAEDLGLQAGVA